MRNLKELRKHYLHVNIPFLTCGLENSCSKSVERKFLGCLKNLKTTLHIQPYPLHYLTFFIFTGPSFFTLVELTQTSKDIYK